MKYGIVSITTKNFTIPDIQKGIFLDGKLSRTVMLYKTSEGAKSYPFAIDWKYELYHNSKHVLTYDANTRFIIEDDGVPFDNHELDRFIGDLYINVELGWENQTSSGLLFGNTMPALSQEHLKNIREQIFDFLK